MDIDLAVRYLKLLANESRLRVLALLADHERSVGELAEILELREPTVSHHLARLADAGLVSVRPEGTVRYYRLESDTLERLSRDLFPAERRSPVIDDTAANDWERKVLATYLEGERLTKIPESRKKRDVVLRWLVEKFERERSYPEKEVNEIISHHHPDFATLRRELVGARLMWRENSVYQREPHPVHAG